MIEDINKIDIILVMQMRKSMLIAIYAPLENIFEPFVILAFSSSFELLVNPCFSLILEVGSLVSILGPRKCVFGLRLGKDASRLGCAKGFS